ncbi:MAG TPA: SRPBCC domain-containing protein [Myxococcales bacterium]|nr:SRPBCC domain-containing protein [Myxococcales bacterium]
MADAFELEMIVPAEPQRVFSAWLDAKEHAAFTGGGEAVVEPWTGGRFIAWDGYIHGILLGVDPARRLVQTWRTSEFPPEARDSRLVVEFEAARGGTRVVVRHSDVPPSQAKRYEKGWMEHYLKPLARYFAKGGRGPKTPAPRAGQGAWGRRPERKARRAAIPGAGAATRAATAGKPAAPRSAPRKAAPRKAAARKTPVRKLHAPARPAPAARKKSASRRPRR